MALDFTFTEEHEMIRQTVRDIVDRFASRRAEFKKMLLTERKFPQEIWDALAEAGLTGAVIPAEYGGSGLGLLGMVIAMEELGAHGLGNTVLILTAMDSVCIARNGSAEMKQRFLPDIAAGKVKLCFAVTEPDAGSNTFRITTLARRVGDHYELSGQKVFITAADVTDYILLVARTLTIEEAQAKGMSKLEGLSLFLVPTNAPGLDRRMLPMRGIEGYSQFQLYLDRVPVGREYLVGEENKGAFALFNTLNPERILAAAHLCGTMQFLLDRACNYAKERKVFGGKPIGSHQAIAHPLAETRIQLDAARLLTYRAGWAFDREDAPGVVGTYANMAKYTAAEACIQAADRAIETLGGYGFSEEYDVIHAWEGARLVRTAPVTKEMILNFISEHVLGLPRSY
jgi:alkylation response protein AidB-like acyl-CoA dehydrogenase